MCAKENDLSKNNLYESERMSRRAALKRLGITTGMALFSLLTVDDMARLAARKLNDHGVCEDLAAEFKNAGIAVAQTGGDCNERCNQIYNQCITDCGCPVGCNCAGGSLWPWCLAYNFCIGPFSPSITSRTTCYQNCVANGE